MKVVCAWCEREGQPSYLGEREPSENRATTHGICLSHKEQSLEGLASQSFPDVGMLIVVRPDDPNLYESLVRTFGGMPDVRIIVDQRRADRLVGERVRVERRIRRGRVFATGYTVVRFSPRSYSKSLGSSAEIENPPPGSLMT
ncbi:MAG TPA: hypothetical protein VIF11_21960 [Methylomirabilota bacterium]|jgi:hypothetical protein